MADYNFNLKPPDSIPGQAAYGAYGVYTLWKRVNAIGSSGGGGGGTPALTSTYIGYGDTNNLLTGSGDMVYNTVRSSFDVGFSGTKILHINPDSSSISSVGVTIGNLEGNQTIITVDDTTQLIKISNVPTYASDALAIAGGLVSGNLYKTTVAGVTFQCIVP